MEHTQGNTVLHNLGQDIFDIIIAVESIAFYSDSKVLSEEFGSYSQNTNDDRSETIDSFKLKNGLAVLTIHSAPNFPDEWGTDYKLEMKVNDSLVLKGRIIKEQHEQTDSIFIDFKAETFAEGPWLMEIKHLAELYRNRLIEAQKDQDAKLRKIQEDRIHRKLDKSKSNPGNKK